MADMLNGVRPAAQAVTPRAGRTNPAPAPALNNVYRVKILGRLREQLTVTTFHYLGDKAVNTPQAIVDFPAVYDAFVAVAGRFKRSRVVCLWTGLASRSLWTAPTTRPQRHTSGCKTQQSSRARAPRRAFQTRWPRRSSSGRNTAGSAAEGGSRSLPCPPCGKPRAE